MRTRARTFRGLTGAALTLSLTLTGCSHSAGTPPRLQTDIESAAVPLKHYASCDEALATLRLAQRAAASRPRHFTAAEPGAVAPAAPGMGTDQPGSDSAKQSAAAASPDSSNPGTSPDHSTTNTAEPGVDEPDTVKTDGKVIVTAAHGVVTVVSTSDKRILGSVQVPEAVLSSYQSEGDTDQLLLSGDRVLVIGQAPFADDPADPAGSGDTAGSDGQDPGDGPAAGGPLTRFTLVDIGDPAHPRVVSTLRMSGTFVDARMTGGVVRAVTRSNPVVPEAASPGTGSGTGWLPHYRLESHLGGAGGAPSVTDGTVDCASLRHPDVYSGTALLSLETFDLGAPAARYSLGTGSPVSVVADGDTVYATGSSLYIANDLHRWQNVPLIRPGLLATGSAAVANPYLPPAARTEVYKFDISGTAAPRPVASGSVPGWLLNQYSLSEYQGNLRIATTDGAYKDHADAGSSSAVYVLAPHGNTFVRIGAVTGLGQGEKIYSFRFAGPVGYVVTFRQMDPLFVIDLRDPAHPRTAGQLELTGYSSYLHPVDDRTLIGLGQAATATGRRLGTQVSLFDVSDPSAPRLAARFELPEAYSGAEEDPHAFLYWKPTGLLVVPVSQSSDRFAGSASGALVLRVGDGRITEEGFVEHAGRSGGATFGSIPGVEQITRSLVANDTLWTVSGAGLLASNGLTLEDMGWIPYP